MQLQQRVQPLSEQFRRLLLGSVPMSRHLLYYCGRPVHLSSPNDSLQQPLLLVHTPVLYFLPSRRRLFGVHQSIRGDERSMPMPSHFRAQWQHLCLWTRKGVRLFFESMCVMHFVKLQYLRYSFNLPNLCITVRSLKLKPVRVPSNLRSQLSGRRMRLPKWPSARWNCLRRMHTVPMHPMPDSQHLRNLCSHLRRLLLGSVPVSRHFLHDREQCLHLSCSDHSLQQPLLLVHTPVLYFLPSRQRLLSLLESIRGQQRSLPMSSHLHSQRNNLCLRFRPSPRLICQPMRGLHSLQLQHLCHSLNLSNLCFAIHLVKCKSVCLSSNFRGQLSWRRMRVSSPILALQRSLLLLQRAQLSVLPVH